MSNATQSYRLLQLMKTGNMVPKEQIAKELGVVLMSVPVYIHELKKQHKAEVMSIRNGRKVVGYKLINNDLNISEFRKNSVVYKTPDSVKNKKNKKVSLVSETGEIPVIDKDAEITQLTDREFADIENSLGIESFHSVE